MADDDKKTPNKSTEEKSSFDPDEYDDIKVFGNEIYFHADVDTDSVCFLFKLLREVERDLIVKSTEVPGFKPEIRLYIHSNGGDMFAGFGAHDQLKQMRVPVTTIADGICASAATFILMGGHTRLIKKRSYVLIHQLSSQTWGKFNDMKEEVKNCEKFMEMAKDMYEEHCDIPEKKFKTFMKKDVYIDAKECIKWKIVDGILDPAPLIKF